MTEGGSKGLRLQLLRQWLWELTIYEGPLPEASLLPSLAGNP